MKIQPETNIPIKDKCPNLRQISQSKTNVPILDKSPNLRQMSHLELCPYVKRRVDPAVVVKNLARHPTR